MTTEEISTNFNKIINVWINESDTYTDIYFALKPDEENWSIGQVCQHLITSTGRIFGVIDKC
ncbi:MAG TPA: hypothetical protein VNX68_12445, partial [Nitrosopumilaceae archaeon]|nr:hypothetical protein [Nitrosopumilaceae archaeon]